jgi:hypothetical protein
LIGIVFDRLAGARRTGAKTCAKHYNQCEKKQTDFHGHSSSTIQPQNHFLFIAARCRPAASQNDSVPRGSTILPQPSMESFNFAMELA